ncbi:cutinase [Rhodococcus rhodochrous]|uniref:cutinase family protein n=1 Tax=Rhodococcus rhodochrous TaxID=1829 RepID=UPI000AE7A799|nr:cutinase family protein [Rhodococcus rhodochrous]SNV12192.1 cutinase [Rhodococcus rhodochrous]
MSDFACRRVLAIIAGLTLGLTGPVAAAATAGTASTAGAETFRPCPERFVIAVDGTRNIDTPDSIDPDSPLAKISARYAAPGTVVEHIRYPAVVVPVPESGSSEGSGRLAYDESKRIGHQRLRETITVRHSSCPDSELVVLGYSQGASIAGDVLAEIAADGSVPPERISGVLYSDPRDTRGGRDAVPRRGRSGHHTQWRSRRLRADRRRTDLHRGRRGLRRRDAGGERRMVGRERHRLPEVAHDLSRLRPVRIVAPGRTRVRAYRFGIVDS